MASGRKLGPQPRHPWCPRSWRPRSRNAREERPKVRMVRAQDIQAASRRWWMETGPREWSGAEVPSLRVPGDPWPPGSTMCRGCQPAGPDSRSVMDPDAKGTGGFKAVVEGDVQIVPRLVADHCRGRVQRRCPGEATFPCGMHATG